MTKRCCLAGLLVPMFALPAWADPLPNIGATVRDAWEQGRRAALPVVRRLIEDETRPNHYDLLAALVQLGGKDALPELHRLLREEQVYWHNLGLNVDEDGKISRRRFDYLVELLTRLGELGYRDDQELVRAVRDQFRDHPILGAYATSGGSSPVVLAADAILSRP
jgi:hypothetical protein